MRIADLKIDDVIRFQQATPDFSFDNLAIVDNVYSHYDGKMKWYAELEMMNGNKVTIDDTYDFCKVNEPFTRKVDMDKRPSHYEGKDGIDVIDFLYQQLPFEEFKGFMKGNMIKYPVRSGRKDDEIEDIKKARNYADRLLEKLEE